MKVLMLAAHIYDSDIPEFTKNKTGYDLMVSDIYKYLSKHDDCYLLTHVITKGHNKIVKHTLLDIARHIRLKDMIAGIKEAILYDGTVLRRIKYFYYSIDKGSIKNVIERIQPDLIHIHGMTIGLKSYFDLCDELNIRYIVTAHGVASGSSLANKCDVACEKKLLKHCVDNGNVIVAISSGVKHRFEQFINQSSNNIRVIWNGTNIPNNSIVKKVDNSFKYSDKKVFLCVGNICERKNQIQIIESLSHISEEIRNNILVVFCGRDLLQSKLEYRAKELNVSESVLFLGYLNKEELDSWYRISFANIVASKDEGFGLSIIEGYQYGLPTVSFGDLDAIEDVYNADCMIISASRDSKSLAEAIEKTYLRNWNRKTIKSFGRNFTLDEMAQKYHSLYSEIVCNNYC